VPLLLVLATSCGITAETATPDCSSVERLALVAQSVPGAAYVPCVQGLPAGWRTTRFDASDGSTRLSLLSDRSGGRPVDVTLEASCDVTGASPAVPRAEGVRSYLLLRSVSGTYAGTMYDVFPGGCVRYRFAFPRGPHIPLMEELAATVRLVRRGDVRLDLRDRLGVELDP
jgi:hypothetical protein